LAQQVATVAERLWRSRSRALLVSDSQSVSDQLLCNWINHLLDGYGHTLELESASLQKLGDDRALEQLVAEIEAGQVDVLIVRGVNPVYDLPGGAALAEALANVPLSVVIAQREDETSVHAKVVCPESHELESWSDAEPVTGALSLTQPVIGKIYDSRTFAECLAAWSGTPASAHDLVRQVWSTEVHGRAGSAPGFDVFWDRAVHDGYLDLAVGQEATAATAFDLAALPDPVADAPAESSSGGYSLVLYPKISQLDGRHAHNPWLQELPDPITKACWDNYACLAPETAAALAVENGDLVRIGGGADPNTEALLLPALVQPGQHAGTVAVALGYGRSGTDRFTDIGPQWLEARPTVADNGTVGTRANGLVVFEGGTRSLVRSGVTVEKADGHVDLALTQTTSSLTPEGLRAPLDGSPRPMVQETVISAYIKDPTAGTPPAHHFDSDLWPGHEMTGHHWGLAVDLNACTGCSACVIACQAENNVPVVGRDEVRRRREMHWIRIDRYYGDEGDVSFQPMMCQQCDNAPCETVCPVVATVHSAEGLNQQVYNRCVGTRYCANNCPYKVRRFNWFNYAHDDLLENLALNPDVVVRTRGVMEKCTFCVQRIEDRKINAKVEGRELEDGEIQSACQQSCPAGAIVFGDMNDPESQVSKMAESGRHFRVLEEMNVQPSVAYLRRVRNREAADNHHALEDTAGAAHGSAREESTHG
jgi:molybdopterin-containing oxidoreductase family iron-sulfur binding subunit